MAQVTDGINSVLSIPSVYTIVETAMGALAAHKTIIRQYVQPRWGDRILDIGCGPGDVVRFLRPGVEYVGFDESPAYIRTARRRFGRRAVFHCDRVRDKTLEEQGTFDFVLAFGVLHHLDDPEALDLFKLAFQALRPGGRLFTLDGCYMPGQGPLALAAGQRPRQECPDSGGIHAPGRGRFLQHLGHCPPRYLLGPVHGIDPGVPALDDGRSHNKPGWPSRAWIARL